MNSLAHSPRPREACLPSAWRWGGGGGGWGVCGSWREGDGEGRRRCSVLSRGPWELWSQRRTGGAGGPGAAGAAHETRCLSPLPSVGEVRVVEAAAGEIESPLQSPRTAGEVRRDAERWETTRRSAEISRDRPRSAGARLKPLVEVGVVVAVVSDPLVIPTHLLSAERHGGRAAPLRPPNEPSRQSRRAAERSGLAAGSHTVHHEPRLRSLAP